jgi:6-phosphogluconolactonase (cycloisomerase 2 family)
VDLTGTGQIGFQVWNVDSATGALQQVSASAVANSNVSYYPLLMDPGGKFLYAAQPELGAYAINSTTGQLTPGPLSLAPVTFTIFVSATIDSQGKFIFMAGTKNDSLAGFAISSSTGAPTLASSAPSLPFSPGAMTIVKLP